MKTETVRVLDEYAWNSDIFRETFKQLDPTGIKILSTMAEIGPRNLRAVSRVTGIPFTTVCSRINRIESKSKRVVNLVPDVSKLGMTRLLVLVTAKPGLEDIVSEALEIPNYWRAVERCEGPFTHHSIHIVPVKFQRTFEEYMSNMYAKNLLRSYRIIETGPSHSIFADFSSYDPALKEWEFTWDEWLLDVATAVPTEGITDPQRRSIGARKIDFEIIRELELNGRARFREIAGKLKTSAQTVKYHYDKLLAPSGALRFHFDVAPYPVDIAAHHEFMLEFSDGASMNRFFSVSKKLFFIDQIAKRLRRNVLLVRTRMINSQVENMFTFFSEMTNAGLLTSYSAVRLRMENRIHQTISDELFDDEEGWKWDVYNNLLALNKL